MTDHNIGEAARRRYRAILGELLSPSQPDGINETNPQTAIHLDALVESSEIKVDRVFGIIDPDNAKHVQTIIEKIWQCLKPGGAVILDFVDFSKTQGFPISYVLDQFAEYISSYQKMQGPELTTSGIRSLFSTEKFEQIDVQAVVPRFLEADQRSLPALVLESLGRFLVDNAFGTQVELDAIISELRHLSTQQHVMISGPMSFHVSANKKL